MVGKVLTAGAVSALAAYTGLVSGRLTLDIGLGRRLRPLGPIELAIAAPREVVFDVIAAPYLGQTPRAMADKLRVLERGQDMVLAEHITPLSAGMRAITVETVRFERPHRISFRLLRGPVPHVVETFELDATDAATRFVYRGELGTDLWSVGAWWGDRVADRWEHAVAQSVDAVRTEAERRARARSRDSV